jgi:DNA invertase Pin-like site-specific DNA recombinase
VAVVLYKRVSTKKQSTSRQEFQLDKLGVRYDKSYVDKVTGKNADRPQLNKLMLDVQSGDIIYVESISRLGRNVDDLRKLCEYFKDKGSTIFFVKEGINTDGDSYKFLLTVLGAVAEIERERISELVRQGVEKCKATGVTKTGRWFGGQHKTVEDLPRSFSKYYTQVQEGTITKVEMSKLLGVSKPTLFRWIKLYESNAN